MLLRRMTQISIIVFIIAVPLYSQNTDNWSASSIINGQLPIPSVATVFGDTWSLSIGDFTIIHPAAFIDFVFSAKSVSSSIVIAVLIPLLITLLFGRVFCSWLCPMGFILELTTKFNAFMKIKGLTRKINIKNIRYTVLAFFLIIAFYFKFPAISIIDPPHLLGREFLMIFTHKEISLSGCIFLLAIVLFEIFIVSRAWCRFLCPSGACLSLLGMKRIWRIRANKNKCAGCQKCRSICPYGLEPDQMENYNTLQKAICDNCGLCRDVCKTGAISYSFDLKLCPFT